MPNSEESVSSCMTSVGQSERLSGIDTSQCQVSKIHNASRISLTEGLARIVCKRAYTDWSGE